MLDLIRANAQSWGVKIAFGLIIIVFVFWGVGSFRPSDSAVIMKINGTAITAQDFMRRYALQVEQVQAGNPNLTREDLESMAPNLKNQILQLMMMETLLAQEGERIGVSVTPYELRQRISSFAAFHNDQGAFDPAVYERVLKAQNMTPGSFEESVRRELLVQKFQLITSAPAYTTPQQARNLFFFQGQQRVLDALVFKSADYMDQAKPTGEEVEAYYKTHQASYQIPPQADVSYVTISGETLAASETTEQPEVEAYYEKNKSAYSRPERVHARHILILAAQDADKATDDAAKAKIDEIAAQIKGGKDFAETAKAFSQDGSAQDGGDLGWFERGRMVPEFEQAAFALKPGEVSDPVRSPFGWHLIKLEEKAAADIIPLAEVQDDIRHTLAVEKARARVQNVLDSVLMATIGGQSLDEAAAKEGLEARQTGLQDAQELTQELQLKPAEVQTILASPEGKTLETAFSIGDGYLLAHVVKSEPARTKAFDEVRDEIATQLQGEKAQQLASEAATEALKTITDPLPEALAARMVVTPPMGRDGVAAGFSAYNMTLADAVFNTESKDWLPVAYAVDDGAALVRVKEVVPPTEEAWNAMEGRVVNALTNMKQEQQYLAFLNGLRQAADIKYLNMKLLEQIGQ